MSNVELKQGFCAYCGQAISGGLATDQEEADAKATYECDCAGARAHRKKEQQKAEAKSKVREIFSDGTMCNEPDDGVLEMMFEAVDLIADGLLKSLTMVIPRVGTAKMSINSKGGIAIERKKTVSKKAVADSREV